ncbi:MAG: type II toxin-antitoxin system prevent-host-death family antitoxin [Gemmatimonadaceae bacterium]
MKHTYSLYDAKAKLSALVRKVREGHHVTITLHGEPVAELRPVGKSAMGLAARLKELEERGVLIPAVDPRAPLKPIARRPGALKRFLDERD